ncbi:molybdenum cofactor guanylyltransferase MobA [Motiliproteus coralliicola]|uniref:Molybdenum cofactor guanylyltransferase n=1 Tax=Motiliproteus coralliicola TaxID=2283196 RepID=A0A369WUA8_9GAMM|nr:molybdenum cofactor guanylyltransferase MobA [Motiliproteus coralliicola]RDE24126.1 molybdenum cofactor guanylyltransferase MobA [Motiliproteus coralliicola]
MTKQLQLTALILAGGRGMRMGGVDKGLVALQHQRLVEHVLTRVRPQVDQIIISANRSLTQYQDYGYPVLQDQLEGFQGPLSGINEGLKHCTTDWLLVAPCDSPALPTDLASRLGQAIEQQQSRAAIAHDGRYLQPAFSLLHRELQPSLQAYLNAGGRKLGQWLHQQNPSIVDFSDQPDSFINLNSPEQLAQFQLQLKSPSE